MRNVGKEAFVSTANLWIAKAKQLLNSTFLPPLLRLLNDVTATSSPPFGATNGRKVVVEISTLSVLRIPGTPACTK